MVLARHLALKMGEYAVVLFIACAVGGTPGRHVPDGHAWVAVWCLYFGLAPFCKNPARASQLFLSTIEAGMLTIAMAPATFFAIMAPRNPEEMLQHKLHHASITLATGLMGASSVGEATGILFPGASSAMASVVLLFMADMLMNHPGKTDVESLGHRMTGGSLMAAAVGAACMTTRQCARQGRMAFGYFVSLAGVVMANIALYRRYFMSDDVDMDAMVMHLGTGSGAVALATFFIARLSCYYRNRPGMEKVPADPTEVARINADLRD